MRRLRRMAVLLAGGLLVVVGALLLVLPGPGLLVVLAGLLVLAREFPAVERFVHPVRRRALQAVEDSMATRARVAGSVLFGVGLIAAGAVWIYDPGVPLGGAGLGGGLVASGVAVLALLAVSHRRNRAAAERAVTERTHPPGSPEAGSGRARSPG